MLQPRNVRPQKVIESDRREDVQLTLLLAPDFVFLKRVMLFVRFPSYPTFPCDTTYSVVYYAQYIRDYESTLPAIWLTHHDYSKIHRGFMNRRLPQTVCHAWRTTTPCVLVGGTFNPILVPSRSMDPRKLFPCAVLYNISTVWTDFPRQSTQMSKS